MNVCPFNLMPAWTVYLLGMHTAPWQLHSQCRWCPRNQRQFCGHQTAGTAHCPVGQRGDFFMSSSIARSYRHILYAQLSRYNKYYRFKQNVLNYSKYKLDMDIHHISVPPPNLPCDPLVCKPICQCGYHEHYKRST